MTAQPSGARCCSPLAVALSSFLLLASLNAFAQTDAPPKCAAFEQLSVPQLAHEWQQLRRLRGHFDGASWRAEVDQWQGRKHCVLNALHARFLVKLPSEQQVLRVMGAADASASPSSPPQLRTPPAACAGAMASASDLIHTETTNLAWAWYRWRGTHDGVLIYYKQGQFVQAFWCFSQE